MFPSTFEKLHVFPSDTESFENVVKLACLDGTKKNTRMILRKFRLFCCPTVGTVQLSMWIVGFSWYEQQPNVFR